MTRFSHQMPFGAQLIDDNHTRFAIWAPDLEKLTLEIPDRGPITMERDPDGMHRCILDVGESTTYQYRVSQELAVPDPASRLQLDDVHGSSVVVNPQAYEWQHPDWKGRPWQETVIYEIHVGCYGGFAAVEEEMPRLAKLGITAVELMPIADFSGKRNWGYDGVLPYAPDTAYGTPEQLKHMIDRAHSLGLCVYLDVVYNHFGPDGNYLHSYASQFFSEDKPSPWGPSIDFSQQPVREFFTNNALYWLMEYRFDGLRFDAVHAISDPDWLNEMASRIRRTCEPGRHVHLMLENERNISSHLEKDFDAQWNDDIHNILHVMLTGEYEGYYANYQDANYPRTKAEQLARALAEGFIYQGEPAPSRDNRPRGTPSGHLPPHAFVFFLQNHDQIGNRALGERLISLANPDALKAAIALQLLCPQIPLLFMGEERGLDTPFLFFTDFHGELAQAVREGRRREFRAFSHFAKSEAQARIPDPNAPETFQQSANQVAVSTAKMGSQQQEYEILYRHLLGLRRTYVTPYLSTAKSLGASAVGDSCVVAAWQLGSSRVLRIAVNLGTNEALIKPMNGNALVETKVGATAKAQEGIALARATTVFVEQS